MTAGSPVASFTLHPGDVAIGERGDRFETLLGSCVAIVLTDPRRTVGAMCHLVHAFPARADDAAFGEVALQRMLHGLVARGLAPSCCEAYVIGGGDLFESTPARRRVGEHNSQWALSALQALGVRLLGVDVGGRVYRTVAWTVGPEAPRIRVHPMERIGHGPTRA